MANNGKGLYPYTDKFVCFEFTADHWVTAERDEFGFWELDDISRSHDPHYHKEEMGIMTQHSSMSEGYISD